MLVKLSRNNFINELVGHNYFSVVYSLDLKQYMLICLVCWIAEYQRFYKITEEDYNLFRDNPDEFCKKFEREISQRGDVCFTENFMGSASLRDYDGLNGFQQMYPAKESNPFQGYKLVDDVLFARIVWKDNEIYVPPVQAIKNPDNSRSFPLREKCELQYDATNTTPICYKLKAEFC